MINILDIRTLFIGYSISNAICAIVMGFLWRQNRRRYPGPGFWLANFIMQFATVLLVALRGVVPDFFSMVVANTLAVAGTILLYMGMQHFVGKVGSQLHNYFLLAVFFFVHVYFTYVQPNLEARNHNFSFATLLVCIQIAWLMLYRVEARFRPDTTRIGFIFVAFSLINIFRLLFETNLSTNDFFQSGIIGALSTLAYQMLYIGLTFTLFLTINNRLINTLEHNIVERKQAEVVLRKSEAMFRAMVETLPLAIRLSVGVEQTSEYINPTMVRMFGYTLEEIPTTELWQSLAYPDETYRKQVAEEWTTKVTRAIETQSPIEPMETVVTCKDGSQKNILWGYVPMGDKNYSCGIDLTGRKQSEEALRQSEILLRSVLETLPVGIWLVDRMGQIVQGNLAGQKIWAGIRYVGVSDYSVYKGWWVATGQLIQPDEWAAARAVTHGETSLDDEIEIECFDGTHKYVLNSAVPLRDAQGKIAGAVVINQDITERKQMELSLQLRLMELEIITELSASLRAGRNLQELLYLLLRETLKAVNTLDGCILLFDPMDNNLKLTESGGWFKTTTNLSQNVIEGIAGHVFTSSESYISLDMQNDKLISDQARAFIPPLSSGALFPLHGENGAIGVLIVSFQLPRKISESELRLLTITSQIGANAISRSRLNDQIQLFNVDLQKEIHQKVVAQELLTAEKKLLSTTLMSIADGVIVTDKDGLVVLFNQAAETITGYSLSEAIKKPINHVFNLRISNTFDKVPDVIKYLFELRDDQENQTAYRFPLLITKTGEKILISGNVASLKSVDEDTVGFVIVFQNINEKQKADAQNMLSQKMEAIGQLAAGIAHEINTPIQYVGDNIKFLSKAYSKYSETLAAYQQIVHERLEKPITQDDLDQLEELARQKKVSYYANEIPKAIEESLDGTERVRKIVLAMREFSHPSEKEKKLSDINHGIETTIVISHNEWKYCAELETDLDDELPLVYCQLDEINQVVLNMIVNAAQAIQEKLPQGSEQKGKILISTRKHENKVLITVQDTGPGVLPEIRARIFDPFFTTKGVGKGTGQGLSMAHNIIVTKHHGVIGVDSDPGQGTTFTIELPVDSSELEQQ